MLLAKLTLRLLAKLDDFSHLASCEAMFLASCEANFWRSYISLAPCEATFSLLAKQSDLVILLSFYLLRS